MAKELTHILIAQDVIRQLKGAGQALMAGLIENNLQAYYLGSIIPDALFYEVPPFCLNPLKHVWLSRVLHMKETAESDQRAASFFRSIAATPRAWQLKMAFAAGIITHTTTDRIFHELIERWTTAWEEKGSAALATHREIETLIDMTFLRPLNIDPGQIDLEHLVQLDKNPKRVLFHFYLAHLIEDDGSPDAPLLTALKRAHDQQCLFLRLFASRALYHILKLTNKLVAGRLRAWQTLFYPKVGGPQSFPVLAKIRLNSSSDKGSFDCVLGGCRKAASNEAIRHINSALKRLA